MVMTISILAVVSQQDALDLCYVGCLKPFRTLDDIKLNRITFGQRLETIAANGGEMNKNILAILLLKKPETLAVVKPFYLTCCHTSFLMILLCVMHLRWRRCL